MQPISRYAYITMLLLAPTCLAQNWEVGVMAGGSFYKNVNVTSASGTATTGFKSGAGFSVFLGNNLYRLIGGELRYSYLRNDAKLSGDTGDTGFGSEQHAIAYDFLIHATPVESALRPYVAVGAGVKDFRGTGAERAVQPLATFVLLTQTSDVRAMISVGGGVKFAVPRWKHVLLRLDVHDYMSPFPRRVLTPAPRASVSGWLHNFVPMGGITFTF